MRTRSDGRGRRVLRWHVVGAVAAVFMGATMLAEGARASAAIDITATQGEPTLWLDDASIEVVVSNPGTEPLSSVVVEAVDGDAAWSASAPVAGPDVVTGNSDDVLDPGEEWSYTALFVNNIYGESRFQVTAEAPDGSEVSAEARVIPEILLPADVAVEAEVTSVEAGESVGWVISATNVSDFVLEISFEARIAVPGSAAGPYTPVSPPFERGGNGDISFDPGETWRWEHSAVVTYDGSHLEVELSFYRPEGGGAGRTGVAASSPITVSATPGTTPPDDTNPADTSPADTDPADTDPPDTTLPDTTLPDTTLPDTTEPLDTGSPGTVEAGAAEDDGNGWTIPVLALLITLLGVGVLIAVRRGTPPTKAT